MQMRSRKGRDRARGGSGAAAKPGPKRVLDAAPDRRIVVDVSDDFHRRVKHAALIEGISMTELVLRVLSPEVDSILERDRS